MLKHQIDFVYKYICGSALRTIAAYPVKYAVKHHKHTDRLQLLTKLQYVVTDKTVFRIDVSLLGKRIKRAFRK